MLIDRLILIDSILTPLMLGTPQAANITMADRELPHAGQRIAPPSKQTNRKDAILRLARAETFSGRSINRAISAVSFDRPLSPEQTLARRVSRLPNAASSLRQ